MKSRLALGLMILGMAAMVGCQSNRSIVRGQSPPPNSHAMNAPMGPMPGPMYYNGPAGSDSMAYANGQWRPEWSLHPNDCPENYAWPTHHHTYDYRQPKDLTYPPQNQPAGVVVNPYYTCKGPSDFFMK